MRISIPSRRSRGGWTRSLGSTESDPRQGVSVRQEAKYCVTWSVVGKGELHSNHSLLKRTRDGTVADNPVIAGNPSNRTPDSRFWRISSPPTPQFSSCKCYGSRRFFGAHAHAMSLIGSARVSTAEGRRLNALPVKFPGPHALESNSEREVRQQGLRGPRTPEAGCAPKMKSGLPGAYKREEYFCKNRKLRNKKESLTVLLKTA